MAEFKEVMRQLNRMCKANADCINCPLYRLDGVTDECHMWKFPDQLDNVENEVLKWAAEHPEPTYPTWGEWLEKQGIVKLFNGVCMLLKNVENQIPADIARQLGIELKDGV